MARLAPRANVWLVTSGWLVGVVLFVRFAQILPCCQVPSVEAALRANICGQSLAVTPCPRYASAAPR
jgi:hypothetical protein